MAPNPIGFRPETNSVTSADFVPMNLSRSEGVTASEVANPIEMLRPTSEATRQFATIQDCGHVFFISPLYVTVERLGGEWSAQSTDLGLIGGGESEFEALDDLRSQIGELYAALHEMKDSLAPMLQAQLAFLDRLAAPR